MLRLKKMDCFLIALIPFTWLIGGISYSFSTNWFGLAGLFGNIESLPNVFAPVTALFGGGAAIGAIYAVYDQRRNFEKEQKLNIINSLWSTHVTHTQNACFTTQDPHNTIHGHEAIINHTKVINEIITYAAGETQTLDHEVLSNEHSYYLGEIFDQLRDENGEITLSPQELRRYAFQAYCTITKYQLHHFFKNFYSLVVFLMSNEEWVNSDHIKVFINSLSQPEASLLSFYFESTPVDNQEAILDFLTRHDIFRSCRRS